MKKSILSITVISLLCLNTSSFAKSINIGTIEIGGDLDISTSSVEDELENSPIETTTDTTTLSASALYYIRPNIGVGGVWHYESQENKNGEESTNSAIGPVVSYNFSINEQMGLKISGSLLKLAGDEENNVDLSGFGWKTGGQLSYFLNDYVSINGSLNYYSFAYEYDNIYGSTVDFESSGFDLGIGLSVYLYK